MRRNNGDLLLTAQPSAPARGHVSSGGVPPGTNVGTARLRAECDPIGRRSLATGLDAVELEEREPRRWSPAPHAALVSRRHRHRLHDDARELHAHVERPRRTAESELRHAARDRYIDAGGAIDQA